MPCVRSFIDLVTHVHVVQSGGREERRTLAFRDFLREHSDAAREYVALKRHLATVVAGLRRSVLEILDVTRVSTIVPLATDIACGLAMLRDESLAPL